MIGGVAKGATMQVLDEPAVPATLSTERMFLPQEVDYSELPSDGKLLTLYVPFAPYPSPPCVCQTLSAVAQPPTAFTCLGLFSTHVTTS